MFVVFNDPIVVGVIDFLSSVLNNTHLPSLPHLTIQGPFDDKVSLDRISSIKRRLENDAFFIGNPGLFETDRGTALFLRVRSENLEKVWDKPDFPTDKFGFNPHITLYEGIDKGRAERAWSYLRKSRVEMLCREFDVVQYVPKQLDMFPQSRVTGDENAISKMMGRGKLSSSFRATFMAAVNGSDARPTKE